MKPLFIVFALIHTLSSKSYCDEGCSFTESSITHDTIKNWSSSCKKVCGDIIIRSGNNLTEAELKSAFNELTNLNGNLIIEYTNFENLNFLSRKIKFSSEFNAEITIRFNSNLKNVNAIDSWTTEGSFVWNIYENPNLDFEPFCNKDRGSWNMDLNVYGNLKNCDCKSVRINPGSLPYYPNCTSIDGGRYNGLRITDVKSETDLSGLLKLNKITGVLEVFDSNLRNLSFLRNLETIDMSSSYGGNIIDIYSNPKLTRLGFDSLKKLIPNKDGLRISLAWNHPDLCLTINELQLLVDNKVELYSDPEVKICQDGKNICKFDDLSTMKEDCRYIIGKVVVNSKNEESAWKLENVTNVYGSITVQGTKKLTELNFLRHLQQVASVAYGEKKPLIRINSNKKLQIVSLPSLRRLYPDDQKIEITNNELKIFKNKEECLSFQKAVNATVEYDGFSCKEFSQKKITGTKRSSNFHVMEFLVVLLVLYVWVFH